MNFLLDENFPKAAAAVLAGVIVIALRQPCRAAILNRLEWFLRNVPEGAWAGRAFQLRDKTWVAQPPIENAADVG